MRGAKVFGVKTEVRYTHTWRHYDQRPSDDGDAKRRDNIDAFSVQLTYGFGRPGRKNYDERFDDLNDNSQSAIFLNYEYNQGQSNLSTSGNYDQHVIYGGVIFRF
jgi:hypothetical protein